MTNFTKYYRAFCSVALIAVIAISASCSSAKKGSSKSYKVLVFHKIGLGLNGRLAYAHASRIPGSIAIMKLGTENNFVADTTSDENKFTPENLKQYAAVVFISNTGDHVFKDQAHKDAFKAFINAGGGYVGIHAASDGEYAWEWYGKLVGAYFRTHPNGVPKATIDVVDRTSAATKMLPARWERADEWYAFRALPADVHVLLKLDESSAGDAYVKRPDAKMGDNHPLAWWHDYDGGRAFYTALGHTDSSYQEPLFLQHLLAGIEYAMGRKPM
jgi:type 1 glutamine amidotransferase